MSDISEFFGGGGSESKSSAKTKQQKKLLNEMKKGLTIEQIYTGIENTLAAGLTPGLNLIWGFPGDTVENLWKAVDFLLDNDGQAELRTIRPVTPYPGSELYLEAIKRGLLSGPDDFYERKHLNSDLPTVNFTSLSDGEFTEELFLANWRLIDGYYHRCLQEAQKECADFYDGKNPGFRGFRAV